MSVMNDVFDPPLPPIGPARPSIDPCLLTFLRTLSSKIVGKVIAIDINLLIDDELTERRCCVSECIELAIKEGYAIEISPGISITDKGREIVNAKR